MSRETGGAEGAGGEGEAYRILFVCTGNTCRSPMAEAIARRLLEERGWRNVEVASAGTSTLSGLPPSDGAVAVARERGLDLSGHRSAQLTRERVERADLVLAMTPAHAAEAEARGGEGKVALLGAFAAGSESGQGGWSVPDPFGGSDEIYRRTYDALEAMVRKALQRLEPVVAP